MSPGDRLETVWQPFVSRLQAAWELFSDRFAHLRGEIPSS